MQSSTATTTPAGTPPAPRTLVDACGWLAETTPDAVSHEFYANGDELRERLTFGELDRRARDLAAELRRHTEPGDRALLRYPPGTEFVVGLFGCFHAGLTAVPATPLGTPGARSGRDRSDDIAGNARPRVLLSTGPEMDALDSDEVRVDAGPGGPVLMRALDSARVRPVPDGAPTALPEPATPAYLQYSSGSSGSPKGVVLTHGNVTHNLSTIIEMLGVHPGSVSVSWLPVFHDMGLVAGALIPVRAGCRARLMSPAAFLQRPLRWLSLLEGSDVHTAAPNFAYDLCVRRLGDRSPSDLDLSGVRSMIVGAEPVRARSMHAFTAAFAPAGLRRDALLPCYGLAESTLMVTGTPPGDTGPVVRRVDAAALRDHRAEPAPDRPDAREVVGCGTPRPGMRVVLVEPHGTAPSRPGAVGEICVQGPSVGRGYHDTPGSDETFGGRVDGLADPVLRTGDLGFLVDDQLFVAGRLKDLVVIDGTNHHPADLEASVAGAHDALAPERAAVVAVDGGDAERVVVLVELTARAARDPQAWNGPDPVGRAVRRALHRDHGVPVHDVVPLPPGRLPHTSSGKVQRPACRSRYATDGFDAVRLDGDRSRTAPDPTTDPVPATAIESEATA